MQLPVVLPNPGAAIVTGRTGNLLASPRRPFSHHASMTIQVYNRRLPSQVIDNRHAPDVLWAGQCMLAPRCTV